MSADPERARATPLMLAVVVIYRLRAEDSPAYTALASARATHPQLAQEVEVMLWDNTPGERAAPADFAGTFHHDPENPGLAAAYDAALEQAGARGAQWLMLLDQDTEVTAEYLQEAVQTAAMTPAAALVPRLVSGGRTVSPYLPVLQGPAAPIPDSLHGPLRQRVEAFNSGAVLRVSAMQMIGGFDLAFPIDYLDHSTFARLRSAGKTVHLMSNRLAHHLASQTPGRLTGGAILRERATLAGERRYIQRYGTSAEQRAYPLRLLRRALSVIVHRGDLRQAVLIVRTLLGFNP